MSTILHLILDYLVTLMTILGRKVLELLLLMIPGKLVLINIFSSFSLNI